MEKKGKILIFGKRLKEQRKKMKKNMEYVAEKIGVARSTYACYETQGRFPPIETLAKLAEVLNTSTDYLIGLIDDPEPRDINRNVYDYLSNVGHLHWNGIPLSNEELQPLRDLFNIVLRERVPQMKAEEEAKEEESK